MNQPCPECGAVGIPKQETEQHYSPNRVRMWLYLCPNSLCNLLTWTVPLTGDDLAVVDSPLEDG